ncbi:Sucrase/ferredoxin-like-domain-containing protein [Fimicolochytrium jonesii]|uniref:Sucrase/ferredoxin-like-domain-containing protein n=1 Tax=Fimicolochytrium jonesii TaxID=1396493 RepID=UPI0022FEB7CA|nr:Sucrase/ferredoxin-like-domain-containing protein [Fimicolochytrium jonesii]KAI8821649.1 Sucrase/ferredoxin-like-domain-containing protein [Fimicolochytrium jonesii]
MLSALRTTLPRSALRASRLASVSPSLTIRAFPRGSAALVRANARNETVAAFSTTRPSLGSKKDKKERKDEEDSASDLPPHVATVGKYKRHVLVNSRANPWISKINEQDEYYAALQSALTDYGASSIVSPDVDPVSDDSSRSLLILPDGIRIPSVSVSDFPKVAKLFSEPAGSKSSIAFEKDPHKLHILVCIHGARDCRCGDKGLPLYDSLKKEVAKRGLSDTVKVYGVSHIGGHKHAGNAVVYPAGNWYGLLEKEDAGKLLDSALENKVLWDKWRGRLGLTKEEQEGIYRTEISKSSAGAESQPNPAASQETISLTYILPDNATETFEVPVGARLMEIGRDNDLPSLEGTCGGNLECATCHVIVDPAYQNKLPPVTEEEEDMLEYAVGRTDGSRLACQLKATRDLHGVRLMIPTAVPRKFPSMSDFRDAWQPNAAGQRQQQSGFHSFARSNSLRSPSTATSATRINTRFASTTSESPLNTPPPPPPGAQEPPKRDFKSLLREYGPIATITYLTLSFMTFCACLTSIMVLGIDQKQIKTAFRKIKEFLGFHPADPEPELRAADALNDETAKEPTWWERHMPEWLKNPATHAMLTNILLAMAMTKMFLPIKLGITAAIVPTVAKKLRSMGFNLGTKGGYKTAAQKVKEDVRAQAHKAKRRLDD